MVMEGFQLVYERAKSCRDTCQVRDVMNRVVFASGFRHGLKSGYDYHALGVSIFEVPMFSETAEADAGKAFVAYNAYEPPYFSSSPPLLMCLLMRSRLGLRWFTLPLLTLDHVTVNV